MIDAAAEREKIREVENSLRADDSAIWRVRPAEDGGGVQVIIAIRDSETRRVSSLSSCVGKAETADMIRAMARYAGLPDPWPGRTVP